MEAERSPPATHFQPVRIARMAASVAAASTNAIVRENIMAKKLKELSQSEKIDDLRKDVKAIFSHLNSHDEAIRNMTLELETIVNLLKEVAETVKNLEKH